MHTASSIEILREKVELTFGKPCIAVSDTLDLASDIYSKTGSRISPSTLQRFLGLTHSESSLSQHSLDVISRYAVDKPYHAFLAKVTPPPRGNLVPDAWGLELIKLCLQEHHFDTVIKYMKLLPGENEADYGLRLAISDVLGTFIRQDRKAQKQLLPALAEIPQGRFYFYETFVDLDNLHGYYANALDGYLKHTHRVSTSTKKRDLLFALNLQFRRDLFFRSRKAAAKTSHLIRQIETDSFDLNQIKYWFPIARTLFTEIITEGNLKRNGTTGLCISRLHSLCAIAPNVDTTGYVLSEGLQALFFLKQFAAIREIGLEYMPTILKITNDTSFYMPLVLILKEVDLHFSENNFSALNPDSFQLTRIVGCESHYSQILKGLTKH